MSTIQSREKWSLARALSLFFLVSASLSFGDPGGRGGFHHRNWRIARMHAITAHNPVTQTHPRSIRFSHSKMRQDARKRMKSSEQIADQPAETNAGPRPPCNGVN